MKVILSSLILFTSLSYSQPCIPVPAVCSPIGLNGGGIGITYVGLSQIQNSSSNSPGPLQDFTCTDSAYLDVNVPYLFQVTTGQTYEENVTAWIDFSNDGNFDPSEIVFHDSAVVFTHVGYITIPSGILNSFTPIRMRVGSDYSGGVLTGCNNAQYGGYEDYKIFYGLNIGIDEEENKMSAVVSPNPITESALLMFEGNGLKNLKDLQLKIYNSFGQLLSTQTIDGSLPVTISKEVIGAGIFFYQVTGKGLEKIAGKFIVE